MRNGGIFNGPTALGLTLPELPGMLPDEIPSTIPNVLPGTAPTGNGTMPCSGESFFRALQAELKRRGYNVRQDGTWDGCCQSAITKELGAPLWHTDQVKQFLGKTCTTGYVSQFGSPGGPLVVGPEHTVPPDCSSGSDTKGGSPGGTSVNVQQCPQGQVFDVALRSCVPTLDPFNCGQKCASYPQFSQDWAACMLACNSSGGTSILPGTIIPQIPPVPGIVPGTTQAVPPVEPTAADVFGKNLPLILGALAVGIGAVLYFGSRKTQPKPKALPAATRPNSKKRRRSRRRK